MNPISERYEVCWEKDGEDGGRGEKTGETRCDATENGTATEMK